MSVYQESSGLTMWQAGKQRALLLARIFGICSLIGTMISPPWGHAFMLLTLLAWLASGCASPLSWREWLKNPAVSGALFLMLWMALSLIWSSETLANSWAGLWKYRKLLLVGLFVVLFADQRWRMWAFKAWFATTVLLIAYALVISLPAPWGMGWQRVEPMRPFSAYSYITWSVLLTPVVSVGLAWFCQLHFVNVARWLRWAGAGLLALFTSFVLIAQSGRTIYISALSLAVMFVLFQLKGLQRWLTLVMMAIVCVGVFSFHEPTRQRVLRVFDSTQVVNGHEQISSSGLRLSFWQGSLQTFLKHPIVGSGSGSWSQQYNEYAKANPGVPEVPIRGGNAHQEYLMMAAQLGMVGLILWVSWLWRCFVAASRMPSAPDAIAGRSLVMVMATASLFNASLYDSASGHFYCIALGIVFAAWRAKPESDPKSMPESEVKK